MMEKSTAKGFTVGKMEASTDFFKMIQLKDKVH